MNIAELLRDKKIFSLLHRIDEELAGSAREQGCGCGGKLHGGDYPRKARGCLEACMEFFRRRFSFCCALCRKRTTPPSVRFFGRRFYVAAVFALIAPRGVHTARWLSQELQVPVETIRRWRRWWREEFAASAFWLAKCADFAPPVSPAALPAGALERFEGQCLMDRLLGFLRFLSPLTTRVLHV